MKESEISILHTQGKDLQRESFQQEYYVRDPAFSGNQLVYHCGGVFGNWTPLLPQNEKSYPIEFQSSRSRIQRRFIYGDSHLEDGVLHPAGHEVAILARGKLFSMPHWEQKSDSTGSAMVCGTGCHAGFRMDAWQPFQMILLRRKKQICFHSGGEERLDVFALDPSEQPENPIHSRLVESSRWSTLPDILTWCSLPAGWNCT